MTADTPDNFELGQVKIRRASEGDHPTVRQLFQAGLLEGHVPDNDTGADLEKLEEAYFSDEGHSAFWVAGCGDEVIGMIGVQWMADNAAEIRRLRVRDDFRRRGVGAKLVETALGFCRHHGYLKVVLDVRIERGPAIALFEKFGFQLARTREVDCRKLLDFYIDLYREPTGDLA